MCKIPNGIADSTRQAQDQIYRLRAVRDKSQPHRPPYLRRLQIVHFVAIIIFTLTQVLGWNDEALGCLDARDEAH
jgi:hypothetical protein